MLDELDKKIIATVQDEIPIVPRSYLALAEKIGISCYVDHHSIYKQLQAVARIY